MPSAIDDLRAAAAELDLDSTVPRQLVHRRFIDHVLVTDLVRLGEDRFLCGGRLPQMHGYFNETCREPCRSIFAVSELTRQACMAISHRYIDIPEGHFQIVHTAGGAIDDSCDPHDPVAREAEFLVEVRLSDQRYASGALTSLKASYTGYSRFRPVFHGCGSWLLVPRRIYKRMRNQVSRPSGHATPTRDETPRIEPGAVGRRTSDNVLISPPRPCADGVRWQADLIPDPRHPYFFEHEIDHVPGLMLLEGCHQFLQAAANELHGLDPCDLALQAFEMRFRRFAGLAAPVRLEAAVGSGGAAPAPGRRVLFETTASQDGRELAELDLTLARRAGLER